MEERLPLSDVSAVRVLVSGGTSGLGLAMSHTLVTGGAHVVLTGRDAARTSAAAATLDATGPGRAVGVAMDVRSEDSVVGAIAAAQDAIGAIEVLVNNAGIGMRTVNPRFLTDPQPFWTVDPDRFHDLFETNVTGYFLVARAVAPAMARTGAGKIINVSVSESTTRRAGVVPYGPSRAATDSLSHVMAADLAGTGVTVNLLAPGGPTATGMVPADVGDEVRARLLDPAIVGPPIRWLASADSDGISDARIIATEFAAGIRPTAS